ncbi:cytochrome c oxidase assembly factor 4 homolog, mitochondrial [Passerculus sandwichensis]|uniref:cytochrome c oxidase assembly factor 4 homolog, mitochondrial n=1 Tax=Melospiza georgiana TaxID=44398 RepID=UPI0025AC4D62|nr:cytochrome c oxidase assembly factor 4 homolog, mitochondrial [Melospiza georgiana]
MARPGHGWSGAAAAKRGSAEEEEGEDPLDARIARSGCLEQHRQLQECMAERRDWRHCQEQVRAFGACMARRQQQRQRGTGPAQPPD